MGNRVRNRGDERRGKKALYKAFPKRKSVSESAVDWLPGCVGYGKPVEPWVCENCPFRKLCKGEKE